MELTESAAGPGPVGLRAIGQDRFAGLGRAYLDFGLAGLARSGALGLGRPAGSQAAVRALVGAVLRTFGGLFGGAADPPPAVAPSP